MMDDIVDDEDEDFWKELESDIANGLNDEDDCCEEDFANILESGASDSEASMPQEIFPVNTKAKPKKCDDVTSFYHCYCLRSTLFKHRFKSYIGFTTNPERRLKQHNGLIKGGAWKTRRWGRPWEFVLLVTGFPTHKMALQFEWAWQHPGKSLLVRAAIGETAAKTLQRKRGTPGQMCILKTLLELCPDLYQRNQLTLNFLHKYGRSIYDAASAMPALPIVVIAANLKSIREGGKKRKILSKASDAEGLPPAPPLPEVPVASVRVVSNLQEMPFWETRNQSVLHRRTKKNKKAAQQSTKAQGENEMSTTESSKKTTGVNGRSVESTKKNKSIDDLYLRCRTFDFMGDSSSSEEERDDINNKDSKCTSFKDCRGNDDSDSDGDDAISFLTASISDIQMVFSPDSSSHSSENMAIDDPKCSRKKMPSHDTGSIPKNVISIDDDSDNSIDKISSATQLREDKLSNTKKGRLMLEEKIDAMIARNETCDENGENDDSEIVFVSSSSLNQKLNVVTKLKDLASPVRNDNATRGPFENFGVTTRRPKKISKISSSPQEKITKYDGNDFVSYVDSDESDNDGKCSRNENSASSILMSPSSVNQSISMKRLSIVDLCTP